MRKALKEDMAFCLAWIIRVRSSPIPGPSPREGCKAPLLGRGDGEREAVTAYSTKNFGLGCSLLFRQVFLGLHLYQSTRGPVELEFHGSNTRILLALFDLEEIFRLSFC